MKRAGRRNGLTTSDSVSRSCLCRSAFSSTKTKGAGVSATTGRGNGFAAFRAGGNRFAALKIRWSERGEQERSGCLCRWTGGTS